MTVAYFSSVATMKLALWIFLVMSLAGTPQLACGEESVSAFSNDNSTDDEPIAEMETETHDDDDLDLDDELDDEAEEDEQKAASLFDQLYERGKKKGRKGKGSKGKKGKGNQKGGAKKKKKSLKIRKKNKKIKNKLPARITKKGMYSFSERT